MPKKKKCLRINYHVPIIEDPVGELNDTILYEILENSYQEENKIRYKKF